MHKGLWLALIALLIVSTLCGCVRRRMIIGSNPSGATVYLDGKEIGRTPFSTNFTRYGKREFRIVKQGYETKTELVPVPAPWYQWVGFDFVSEVLLPGKLTDNKHYEFDLQPEKAVSGTDIVTRAEQFRQTAHADGMPQIGGSPVVLPQTSAPASSVGSIPYPTPNLAPIVPGETFPSPPNAPPSPNTFVPPAF